MHILFGTSDKADFVPLSLYFVDKFCHGDRPVGTIPRKVDFEASSSVTASTAAVDAESNHENNSQQRQRDDQGLHIGWLSREPGSSIYEKQHRTNKLNNHKNAVNKANR